MADFNGTILTDKGRNLLAKALTGTELKFTKVSLGDGVWSDSVSPESLTDLVSKKMDLAINALDVTGDGTARLRFVLTNTGLEEGFFTREIGIYADDPDDGEILYAVTYSQNPDFIPSDGVVKIENVTDIYTVVSNAQNVEAVISDTVVIATKDDVKSLAGVADELILEKLKNVDGSGSGLDADKIDGLESIQFVRSDKQTNMTADLNMQGNTLRFNNGNYEVRQILQDDNNFVIYAPFHTLSFGTTPETPVAIDGGLVWHNNVAPASFSNPGYQIFPNGLIIQWGANEYDGSNGSNGQIFSLPITFPNNFFQIIAVDVGGGCHPVGISAVDNGSFKVWGMDADGNYSTTGFHWVAIGN